MNRLKEAVVLAAFTALAAQPVVAQVDTLPDTGNLNYVSHSWVYNGVGVGPYTGAIPGHATIDIYCVDFNHHASRTPTAYNFNNFANIQADIDAGDTLVLDSDTRWGYSGGDPAPLVSGENWENYKKAAYLTTFFRGIANDAGLTSTQKSTKIGELHAAIWHLFNPGNPAGVGWPTIADDTLTGDDWYGRANAGYENYFARNARFWYIASDVNTNGADRGAWNEASGGRQEYLVQVTPEPTSLILLGTGLLGIGMIARRRMTEKEETES